MEAVVGFLLLILLFILPDYEAKTITAEIEAPFALTTQSVTEKKITRAIKGAKENISSKSGTEMEDISVPAGEPSSEAAVWGEKIQKHLPAINAALRLDVSAVGICDVQSLSGGRVGIGTITDYGFTIFHVYDPVEGKIIFSEAFLFGRADRERFTIFFVREKPPANRYSAIPVVRGSGSGKIVLGWIGIPLNRAVPPAKPEYRAPKARIVA